MTDIIAPALTWRKAQSTLWVATTPENHPVGIVRQKWSHGFVVTGRTGRDLGSYRTLDEAEAALAASL